MGTANVIELEACIADCIEYCKNHRDLDFVRYHEPRLKHARHKYDESVDRTDRHFTKWRHEAVDEKIAWKHLGKELRATQTMLRRVNAIGFPQRNILHWDTEALTAAVEEMIAYLAERTDAIDEAGQQIDKLERLLESANSETKDGNNALDEYGRQVLFRSEALGTVNNALAEFRESMRRNLGRHHADYLAIRWPMTLAPDERVL